MSSVLRDKSYLFAIRIVNVYKALVEDKREYVMSKQLLRSGTSVGALVREAEYAQSRADFANKMGVALKEANETEYWLLLLKDTGYINEDLFQSLQSDCKELIKMLITTVKKTRHD